MLTFVSNVGITELAYLLNSLEIHISYNNNIISMLFAGNDYTLYICAAGEKPQIGICANTMVDQQNNTILLWNLNYSLFGNKVIFNLLQKLLYIKGLIFNQYYNYIEIYDNINYFLISSHNNNLCVSYHKDI